MVFKRNLLNQTQFCFLIFRDTTPVVLLHGLSRKEEEVSTLSVSIRQCMKYDYKEQKSNNCFRFMEYFWIEIRTNMDIICMLNSAFLRKISTWAFINYVLEN